MHCRALPIGALPHQPQLLLDYLNSYERVSAFYQHKPQLESVLRVARELQFSADRRMAVTAILRQQNELLGSAQRRAPTSIAWKKAQSPSFPVNRSAFRRPVLRRVQSHRRHAHRKRLD